MWSSTWFDVIYAQWIKLLKTKNQMSSTEAGKTKVGTDVENHVQTA